MGAVRGSGPAEIVMAAQGETRFLAGDTIAGRAGGFSHD